MKFIYTSLNTSEEAKSIAHRLLERKLCNCVNIFPITCIYNYEGKISEEAEVVMIVKTMDSKFAAVEKVIKDSIDYTNFIGELGVNQVNDEFSNWLNSIVK